jgi:subtilase-type serine protease
LGRGARSRGDGNAASLERDTGGFLIGADATFEGTTRVGLAGGYQTTSIDVAARRSSGTTDSVFAALYGGTSLGPFALRLGASFAAQDIEIDRAIVFPGFADRTRASYDGTTAQAFGELGYRFQFPAAVIEPFLGAAAVRVERDRFVEAGGPAALLGRDRDHDVGYVTLGVRTEWQPFAAPLVVRAMAGWWHAFDVVPTAPLAFQSAPTIPFAVAGVPIARDVLVAEAGLDWRVSEAVTLGVAYSARSATAPTTTASRGSSWSGSEADASAPRGKKPSDCGRSGERASPP